MSEKAGDQKAAADRAIDALAHRLWSVHPREIQDLGITREQFYAREIRALIASLNTRAKT